jgi:hypothetical protein
MDRGLTIPWAFGVIPIITLTFCTQRPEYIPIREYLPETVPAQTSQMVFHREILKSWNFQMGTVSLLDSSHANICGSIVGPEGVVDLKLQRTFSDNFWFLNSRNASGPHGFQLRWNHRAELLILDRFHRRVLMVEYPGLKRKLFHIPDIAYRTMENFPHFIVGWFPNPEIPMPVLYYKTAVREHPEFSTSRLVFLSKYRVRKLSLPVEPISFVPGTWKGEKGVFLTTRSPMNGRYDMGMTDIERAYVLFLNLQGVLRWKRGYPGSYAITDVTPLGDQYLVSVLPTYFTEQPFLYLEWLDPIQGNVSRHLRLTGQYSHPFPVNDTLWVVRMDSSLHFIPGWLDTAGNFHPIGIYELPLSCREGHVLARVSGGLRIVDVDGDGNREMVSLLTGTCYMDPDPDHPKASKQLTHLVIWDLSTGSIQNHLPLEGSLENYIFSLQLDGDPLPELIVVEITFNKLFRISRIEYVPQKSAPSL